MQSMKKFGVLTVVAFALCAIGAANATAAAFTASAAGTLTGEATSSQAFGASGGEMRCNAAVTTGSIPSTMSSERHVSVVYSGCTSFGFPAHASPATFLLTANGQVHIKNTITFEVTVPLLPDCHITYGPQTRNTVGYAVSGSYMLVTFNLTNIAYTTTGGACGPSGNNGTYVGTHRFRRVGGGSVGWHP